MIYFIVINGILCGLLNLYVGALRMRLYNLGVIDAFKWVTIKKLKKKLDGYKEADIERTEILNYIKINRVSVALFCLEAVLVVISMINNIHIK